MFPPTLRELMKLLQFLRIWSSCRAKLPFNSRKKVVKRPAGILNYLFLLNERANKCEFFSCGVKRNPALKVFIPHNRRCFKFLKQSNQTIGSNLINGILSCLGIQNKLGSRWFVDVVIGDLFTKIAVSRISRREVGIIQKPDVRHVVAPSTVVLKHPRSTLMRSIREAVAITSHDSLILSPVTP